MSKDLLVRRKRIDFNGEWEYECSQCLLWLPKSDYRGCKVYVDAYGNCLMCSKCRSKKAMETRSENEINASKELLEAIGFYKYVDADTWYEEKKKQLGIK